MAELELSRLQAWLMAQVTAGTWGAAGEVADVVVSSNVLSAQARVGIYARSYVARLAECLKAEFPILKALVGEPVFNLFAGGYLSAHRPWSYSLYDLGSGFPAYLEATRPRPHSGPGTLDALPASLARLERAMAEAHRAPGVEGEPPTRFDPTSLLLDTGTRLRTPESLKLLRLDFDFQPALDAARQDRRPDPPEPADALIAVARSHWRVKIHPLEPWTFTWLETLRDTDGDLGAANRSAAAVSGRLPGEILARLMAWAPLALDCGFVVRRT